MALVVYGIPTCSTCKKARQWLDSRAISYEFVDTKSYPPSPELVSAWINALGSKAMRNTSGLSYRALGDEKQTWGDPEWIKAFSQDAMLLKRPLFVKDGK
ncbi:MAG: Spx/MgsR family RNA polymerase-binding regulatory protein, partial [Nodosilinea sp.]